MKYQISIIFLLTTFLCFSQTGRVGINTEDPQETLDVQGTTIVNKIYLREPGDPESTGNVYLSGDTGGSGFGDYQHSGSIFTYIPLTFKNVPPSGIEKYDTKISADDYVLVIHNYSVLTNTGATSVTLKYNNKDDRQGSPEFVAFKENGTWWVKGGFTNSKMVGGNDKNFIVKLYLMSYRHIITKENIEVQRTNLNYTNGSNTQYSIPTPKGF